MLDVKLLRDNLAEVRARMATRNASIDWEQFVSLDRERRDALASVERLKEKKNRLSGEIGKLKKFGGDAGALMGEVEEVSEAIRQLEKPVAELEDRFTAFLLTLPNLPNPGVKVGRDSSENREVRRWGEPRQFDFEPKNHWDIG